MTGAVLPETQIAIQDTRFYRRENHYTEIFLAKKAVYGSSPDAGQECPLGIYPSI